MFDRDNWPGIVMFGFCAVLAIALLIEIFTDVTFEYTGPRWLAVAISIFGLVLIGIMSWRAWGGRMRRWRGGGTGTPTTTWPHDDVRQSKKQKNDSPSSTDAPVVNDTPEPPPR